MSKCYFSKGQAFQYRKRKQPVIKTECTCDNLKAENWTQMMKEAGIITPSPSDISKQSSSEETCTRCSCKQASTQFGKSVADLTVEASAKETQTNGSGLNGLREKENNSREERQNTCEQSDM